MPVGKYLTEQLEMHSSMQPQDIVKLCYQASFGAEHLLADVSAAKAYFDREYDSCIADGGPLYECISSDYVRLNIRGWKQSGLEKDWLFKLFTASAQPVNDGKERLERLLSEAGKNISEFSFSMAEWEAYLAAYKAKGMPAVHHSDKYRDSEKPAYRLVKRQLLKQLPALKLASEIKKRPCVIAIDGRAGSGKSTLAAELGKTLDAELIHMDDFFLPDELRTGQRLDAPGGNVHYERFREEVIPYLHGGRAFSYRRYSCHENNYSSVNVRAADFLIVEGSYSLHPELGDYADIKLFSDVDAQEQLRRITARDGEKWARKFAELWIPMEEKYFSAFEIMKKADIIIE